MKLFGMFGKQKAVPFPQFRDRVRLVVRRSNPNAMVQNTENGIALTIKNSKHSFNLRQLYADYCKSPAGGDALIQRYVDALATDIPEQGWSEARLILRPTLRSAGHIAYANKEMAKKDDSLPAAPFVSDLCVTVVRELTSTITYVTQKQLDAWGVTLEQALQEAVNNMNMQNFPPIANEMRAGGSGKKKAKDGEVVGVVFEGNHLTATWLALERFRDFVGMRLQGDYVVSVPCRGRLTAARVDEPGLIATMRQQNRNFQQMPYPLTGQCFHISAATTGGVVSVYQSTDSLDPNSLFAAGNTMSHLPNVANASSATGSLSRPLVDFSAWGELSEPIEDASAPESSSRKSGKGGG